MVKFHNAKQMQMTWLHHIISFSFFVAEMHWTWFYCFCCSIAKSQSNGRCAVCWSIYCTL